MSELLTGHQVRYRNRHQPDQAFRKYPLYFDALFCNLVGAGEQAGILDTLLDRLATYKEKILAHQGQDQEGAVLPDRGHHGRAFLITAVIMIFVIPAFKSVFTSFGADLPSPTLVVIAMSDFFVGNWYLIFGGSAAALLRVSGLAALAARCSG